MPRDEQLTGFEPCLKSAQSWEIVLLTVMLCYPTSGRCMMSPQQIFVARMNEEAIKRLESKWDIGEQLP